MPAAFVFQKLAKRQFARLRRFVPVDPKGFRSKKHAFGVSWAFMGVNGIDWNFNPF
jgi:hypothetical protein